MKKLLIIDGNAITHRAYHALPPLTDANGQVVNAVYGFFSMLIKVIEDYTPTHVIVCFDRPKPTFRKALFVGYQAHRPKMEDNLSQQFVVLHKALALANISIFEVDGYEADDLIGTLAHQAGDEKHVETLILTGDRDLLQLVHSRVKVLAPIKGITEMIVYNEEKVKEKYGITPSQFIDYKAIIGDQSDGYPGINGIGPKTAMNLLTEFETFENIYANIAKVKPSIALKLARDAEQGALAKKLATILTDVPIHLRMEESSLFHTTKEDLYAVCDMLNSKSLRKRIESMKVISGQQIALL